MRKPVRYKISRQNILARMVWGFVWALLFRPTPRPLHRWRCLLLRCFGAKVGRNVRVYQSARIWAPWNLELADNSCMGDWVDCYNVAPVYIGQGAVVSQYCYLCTASHDSKLKSLPLIRASIHISEDAWVTAAVFIAPGVTIGQGAVVQARSVVLGDVPAWKIAAGHPASVIKNREFDADK